MEVSFEIPGEPMGKQRPKFAHNGKFSRAYTPKETVNYESLAKLCYMEEAEGFKFPDDSELCLRISAYFSIPKSASKKKRQLMLDGKIRPTKRPDIDNAAKIVADSLNGVAWHDDSAIVDLWVSKFYSDRPRVEVRIFTTD